VTEAAVEPEADSAGEASNGEVAAPEASDGAETGTEA
jgi:hypothetical protein